MNRTQQSFWRNLSFAAAILTLVQSCEIAGPAETPTGDLNFQVFTAASDPVANARVYLFPTESAYESYIQNNPNGEPSITPSLTPDRIGTTNNQGRVTFADVSLDGPFYTSGSTQFYNPNPIYIRVEGSVNGTDYLTNDQDIFKLSFPELESGDMITENTDIVIR